MSGKVYTWNEALRVGHDPRQYGYLPGIIPPAPCIARLDFKWWAQKVIGINGCFTLEDGGKKIQVTVYPSTRHGYRIGKELIDLHSCPEAVLYLISVEADKKGRWVLRNIVRWPVT